MLKIIKKINNLKDYQFTMLGVLLAIFLNIIFNFLEKISIGSNVTLEPFKSRNFDFVTLFLVGIIGVIFETGGLITLIKLISLKVKNNIKVLVLVSVLFGSLHYYNVWHIIWAFFIGIIYVYSYIFYPNKKLPQFLIMFLMHSSYNIIVYIIHYITL